MKQKNNFLYNLAENVINIFNKLFNLFLILAVLISLSEILDNKKIYILAIVIYVLSTFYIVHSSYCLYTIKEMKFNFKEPIRSMSRHLREFLGFILCTSFSMFLLSLTHSATVILNTLSIKL